MEQNPYAAAPTRTPTSPWVARVFLTVVALMEAAVAFVAAAFVQVAFETCGEPVPDDVITQGVGWTAVVAVTALVPWLLAMPWSSHRTRLVLLGSLAASPALLAVLAGFDPDHWTGCLFVF